LFYKLAGRKGDAISIVGVAVHMTVREGKCSLARIALGSVAPTVMRAKQAEDILEGRTLTVSLLEAAARQASQECVPIDDMRASAEYRRHAVRMLSRRLLTRAWDRLS
jgi:carbon-monoxide dehydrogenase medium subunit